MLERLFRRQGIATFALLVVVAEVAGRSLTGRVDRALSVEPLAPSGASYYPFLLVAVKVIAALALAALAARAMRARATESAGRRLLSAVGSRHRRPAPRLRATLSPRAWLVSFASTSLIYLLQADGEGISEGRWPLFAPWLHSYALPVFAVLSVLVAFAWSIARWLHAVEQHAVRTLAHACRILRAALRGPRRFHARPVDDSGPRRLFGLAFESRPPPLPA
jgi:hypothetical protein